MQMQERNLPADHAARIAEQVTLNRLRNGNGALGQSLQDQMVCPVMAQCHTSVLSITYQHAALHVSVQCGIPVQSTSKIEACYYMVRHCMIGRVSSVFDVEYAITNRVTCGACARCRRVLYCM